MKKIKKVLDLLSIILKSFIYKEKVYIFGTPIHGNLGDQAIIYAERVFLNEKFKDKKIIEVESTIAKKGMFILKKVIKSSDLLFISGGGFLGSLWLNEEEMFREVVNNFKDNKIIVFPQTIYFSEDDEGKKILSESKKCYGDNTNLVICCREKYSYDFMKNEFPKIKVILVPDIVLYLDQYENNTNRENALFCIRKDKEKVKYDYKEIENILIEKYGFKIDYTDTVIKENVYKNKRNKKLIDKLSQFRNYKIIVTDRLHGMIFAYLTKTPCLVFENRNYKVRGVYEWIKKSQYIRLFSNSITQEEQIDGLLKIEDNIEKVDIKKEFLPLIEVIRDNI